MLGYPSKELLAAWVDELEPGRRVVNKTGRGITDDAKENAVVRLVTRSESAQSLQMTWESSAPPSTIGSESF